MLPMFTLTLSDAFRRRLEVTPLSIPTPCGKVAGSLNQSASLGAAVGGSSRPPVSADPKKAKRAKKPAKSQTKRTTSPSASPPASPARPQPKSHTSKKVSFAKESAVRPPTPTRMCFRELCRRYKLQPLMVDGTPDSTTCPPVCGYLHKVPSGYRRTDVQSELAHLLPSRLSVEHQKEFYTHLENDSRFV